jgi:hypothetical protein
VQASFSSVMAFSKPGDAILLQLPSYPPFMRAIEDTGRRLIANPMRDDGTRWVLDLGAYEAAHDPRLRVLIFCHPQNPHRARPSPGQNWRQALAGDQTQGLPGGDGGATVRCRLLGGRHPQRRRLPLRRHFLPRSRI